MNLDLPSDIDTTIQSFLAEGRYENEAAVLREALAALKFRDEEVAAIQEGIDDMEAGRVVPWEQVKAKLQSRLESTEE